MGVIRFLLEERFEMANGVIQFAEIALRHSEIEQDALCPGSFSRMLF